MHLAVKVNMRYIVRAFLVLLLMIEPTAGYAQTPEPQSVPGASGISSSSTSQAPQTTENTSAQPAAPEPVASQTQQAPDSSPPAPASPPANTTKAKPKRHHIPGIAIGMIVAGSVLLLLVLNMDR